MINPTHAIKPAKGINTRLDNLNNCFIVLSIWLITDTKINQPKLLNK